MPLFLLRGGQVIHELRELGGAGAHAAADVVAAGAYTGAEAFFERETEHLAESETGVEMVAGTGADAGLFDERPGEFCAGGGGGGGSAAAGVHHAAVDL